MLDLLEAIMSSSLDVVRTSDRRRYMMELEAREKEIAAGLLKASSQPSSPKAVQETDKRIRREIANSNERRRMQCINAGFSSLRALIPQLEGEKLSKAAILQHATEYICSLETDKSRLQKQLQHTKGLLVELGQDRVVTEAYVSNSPPPAKRKKRDTAESSDEGVCSLSDGSDDGGSELQQVNVALRHQMEMERQRYCTLEEQFRLLESELLALLRVRAVPLPVGSVAEQNSAVKQEYHELAEEYRREISEVVVTQETLDSLSPQYDKFQLCRPAPGAFDQRLPQETLHLAAFDQRLPQETSQVEDVSNQRSIIPGSTFYNNMEESMIQHIYTTKSQMNSSPTPATTTAPTPALSSSDQHSFQHHNYCHRDHPRRRHRQQARLEEEQRRQQEATPSYLLRPKENTQNLERLVEAIQHIEGDNILCKIYDHEQSLVIKQHDELNEETKREINGVSDHDQQLRSECSVRDLPQQHHINEENISDEKMTICGDSESSLGLTFKYPIAAHLLHQPLHPSFYRTGVIVHKQ